ncbi:hypothetical protein DEO72_LG2g3136 [Vigna unguiculata]|uniref:Uncharacterized protein n=1 Tax=Vigna unguiculata TaxID=3917 RepID=A0A4D6L2V5_VIGUN|nr:hypothetical protein DEO72_LG2g3136 [Vigna unguiculata]
MAVRLRDDGGRRRRECDGVAAVEAMHVDDGVGVNVVDAVTSGDASSSLRRRCKLVNSNRAATVATFFDEGATGGCFPACVAVARRGRGGHGVCQRRKGDAEGEED